MKVAFLICAHDQPSHLARLVEFLECDWAQTFVHIDKKANVSEFMQRMPKHCSPIFLNKGERVNVNWGGFSQVQATLNLLKRSSSAGIRFNRFCLLSGSDFPIKSLDQIYSAFDCNREFMRVDRRISQLDENNHRKNVRYYHFMDWPLSGLLRRLPRIPRGVYKKISLYHGCNWWSLTDGCVKFIVEFISKNPDFVDFQKYTLSSDEIFFCSIVKNSPFHECITHDFERARNLEEYFSLDEHGCHYIDWRSKGVTLPKVLSEKDFDALQNSKALFARKFREPASSEVLRMVAKSLIH